jgi:PAS domain S-box-containing protein
VLADRRELALVAVERTRMPMVVTDPRQADSPIVLANQAFLDLTGYSANEVLGRNCRFLQGPETDRDSIARLRQGLISGEHFVTVELLNYRKDGSTFWNQVSVSPVQDETGATIYHFGSQKDVTAIRRAEELEAIERLLLKEVDHRAMNALSLVQSILALTRAESVNRYSAPVRGRVDAIARVHRMLGESSWTGVPLRSLVASDASGRIKVDCASVTVSPRLAQPLALVLHELSTNAQRHGALLAEGGEVLVSWEVTDGQLVLRWVEHGARVETPPPEPRLGLSLVASVIERQLGGKADLTWQHDGPALTMAVPVGNNEVRAESQYG